MNKKVLKEIKQVETIRFYTTATPTFLLLGQHTVKSPWRIFFAECESTQGIYRTWNCGRKKVIDQDKHCRSFNGCNCFQFDHLLAQIDRECDDQVIFNLLRNRA